MSEDLIRRSDAIIAIRERLDSPHMQNALQQGACLSILRAIENAPTIEPKRGEWIWHEDEDICNCSECEFEIDATGCIDPMEYVGVFHYCPNCGARMKGADDE